MTELPYTFESLQGLYENLIGDAVQIQQLYDDVVPEGNRYAVT
jgi:hypothetical protein